MSYNRKDGKKQVVTRMTPDLIWAVKVRAAKNKTTFMGILERALCEYLTAEDEREKRAAPPAYAISAKSSESAKTEQKEREQTTANRARKEADEPVKAESATESDEADESTPSMFTDDDDEPKRPVRRDNLETF